MEDPFAFLPENSAHSGVTCGCSDESEYCTQNDTRFHNGFRRNSSQRRYSSPFRNMFNSPVHHRNQFLPGSTRGSKLATGGSNYVHPASSQKQVNLYKWYLIRVAKGSPQNGITDDEAQIAVGGYTAPDLLDCQKFRTAPIESRIEKCKLRTVDGLDVLLMGTIDELCTNDNGFPFQVIHLFLHGFPFNWNHVINICNGQPSLNMPILSVSKIKDCASEEKYKKPDSGCPVVHFDDAETGKSSLLEPEQSLSKAGSPRKSSVRYSKRVTHESQPARLSKRSKCGKFGTEGKPEKLLMFAGSQEKSNVLNESEANLCSGSPNKSVEKDARTPHFKSSDMDSHVQMVQEDKSTFFGREFVGSQDNSNILKGSEANLSSGAPNKSVHPEAPQLKSSDTDSHVKIDQEDILTDSGCELRRTKPLNFSVFHIGKDPVKTEKNVSQRKKIKDFKKKIDTGSSLDEAKLIQPRGTNANQTIVKFPDSKCEADHRTDNQEVEQSSWNNVHLEHLIDNCTPVEEGPLEIQSPISEFADTGCKRRKGRLSRSNTNSRSAYSQASRGILCDKGTMMDNMNINSDGKESNDMAHCELRQEITSTKGRGKDLVKTEENVSQRHKRTREFKKQNDSGSHLDEAKLIQSTGTVKIEDSNANQAIGSFLDSEGDADPRADNQEIEEASQNKVHFEQSIHNCNPVEQTLEIQVPISESTVTGCKKRRGRPNKSNTNSRSAYSQPSRDILCDKGTMMDNMNINSDGKESKDMARCELGLEITPTRGRSKVIVKTEENVSQRYKRTKELKKQNDSGSYLDEAKLIQSPGTVNIEDINAIQTIGRFPDSEGDADPRADNQEIEHASQNKVHFEQSIHNCNPVERTVEIQVPISDITVTGCKRRRERSSRSNTKRNRNSRNAYSKVSRDIFCDEATEIDAIRNISDVKDMTHSEELHQEITPMRPLDKACTGTDERVHAEEDSLADEGLLHFKKNVSSGSAENIPFSSGDIHINNDIIRTRKDVNKLKTKREGKGKRRTGNANSICDVSNGLVCNGITMRDGVKLKIDDISEVANCDPNLVACELELDMSVEHGTELGDNFLKENAGKNKDSLQTQTNDTERTMDTPTGKRQYSHIPPPLPPRRVETTTEEVSKAFGLKTSRSGRILVPPLAHWCNQKIAYDLDGGIIAIFGGSSDKKDDNGGCSFKPPKQAEAIRIQRKLCNAANDVIWNLKCGKKVSKD